MSKLYAVIIDCGDGSNAIVWFTDENIVEVLEDWADDGNPFFASGDGLQLETFTFKDEESRNDFIVRNSLHLDTIESIYQYEAE